MSVRGEGAAGKPKASQEDNRYCRSPLRLHELQVTFSSPDRRAEGHGGRAGGGLRERAEASMRADGWGDIAGGQRAARRYARHSPLWGAALATRAGTGSPFVTLGRFISLVVIAGLLVTTGSKALAQGSGYVGGEEFLVSSGASDAQDYAASIARVTGGGFAIVWTNHSQGWPIAEEVEARVFDSLAAPIGNSFIVNSVANDRQSNPAVSALAGGGFVVVWEDRWQGPLRGQAFAADATRQGGEFPVHADWADMAVVAGAPDGGFIAAWSGLDDDDRGIQARLFGVNGSPSGDLIEVNSTTLGSQTYPSVAVLADAGFVVAWETTVPGGGTGIRARRFAQNGAPGGAEFWVAEPSFQQGRHRPSVAVLANGDFIIAWTQISSDSFTGGISFQRYGSDGEPVGDAVTANASNAGWPSVAGLDDGGFVITWSEYSQAANLAAIRYQRFNAFGQSIGGAQAVDTGDGFAVEPAITSLSNNGFAITWEERIGWDTSASRTSIRARVFSPESSSEGLRGSITITAPPGLGEDRLEWRLAGSSAWQLANRTGTTIYYSNLGVTPVILI